MNSECLELNRRWGNW